MSQLRHRTPGDILVFASFGLVDTLFDTDLVDELQLLMHPFIVGSGRRLRAAATTPRQLNLVGSQVVGQNLSLLTFRTPG